MATSAYRTVVTKILAFALVSLAVAAFLAAVPQNALAASAYGSWSSTKTTTVRPVESETLRIVSSKTTYTYFRYCNYYDNQWQQDSIAYGSGSTYHEVALDSPMTACPDRFADHGNRAGDLHGPYSSCQHKREGQSFWWTKDVTTTYSYQTRQVVSTTPDATTPGTVDQRGTLEGIVESTATGGTMPGVTVRVRTASGKTRAATRTDSNGCYSLKVAKGSYILVISCKGYAVLRYYVRVSADKTSTLECALMVRKGSRAKASGSVLSATTGRCIPGARLAFVRCWGHGSGKVVKRCRCSSTGRYGVRLPRGYYTVIVIKGGYVRTTFDIVVGGGSFSKGQNCVVNPKGNKSSSYRAVLTWGKKPRDLDAYLSCWDSGNSLGQVCYWNRRVSTKGKKAAWLDVDERTGYGPETITFKGGSSRTFSFRVVNYSSDASILKSRAQVKLYKGNKLLRVYNIPASGTGWVWNVFSINGTSLRDTNYITNPTADHSHQK